MTDLVTARLTIEQMSQVLTVEQRLGVRLVAVEGRLPLAELGDEQVEQLRRAEGDSGVVLIAYRREDGDTPPAEAWDLEPVLTFAPLDEEGVGALRAAETDLDLLLLAYTPAGTRRS